MNNERFIPIVDTTLRDGEQAAGVAFSAAEKIQIATALDKAGVDFIEAGIPIMGREEAEALRYIAALPLKAKVIAWNRAILEDIKASVACGFSFVHISAPVSDLHIRQKLGKTREWVEVRLKEAVTFARSCGCDISVGAEDASRADEGFLLRIADLAANLGATHIRYADTVGCLEPLAIYEKMQRLSVRASLPIEFHGHNDFGMAAANTVAAVKGGAHLASVTVLGLGERAGNADMETVVTAIGRFTKYSTGIDSLQVAHLNSLVRKASLR